VCMVKHDDSVEGGRGRKWQGQKEPSTMELWKPSKKDPQPSPVCLALSALVLMTLILILILST
jgi:hypothetical protein